MSKNNNQKLVIINWEIGGKGNYVLKINGVEWGMNDRLVDQASADFNGYGPDKTAFFEAAGREMTKQETEKAEKWKNMATRVTEHGEKGKELAGRCLEELGKIGAEVSYGYAPMGMVAGLMTGQLKFEQNGSMSVDEGKIEVFKHRVCDLVDNGARGISGVTNSSVLIDGEVMLAMAQYEERAKSMLVENGISFKNLVDGIRNGNQGILGLIQEFDRTEPMRNRPKK